MSSRRLVPRIPGMIRYAAIAPARQLAVSVPAAPPSAPAELGNSSFSRGSSPFTFPHSPSSAWPVARAQRRNPIGSRRRCMSSGPTEPLAPHEQTQIRQGVGTCGRRSTGRCWRRPWQRGWRDGWGPRTTTSTITCRGCRPSPRGPPRCTATSAPCIAPSRPDPPQAQQYFDQGLRLTYAFNHDEAIGSYTEGTKADSTCAMCWWGIAYAMGPNINAPMDTAVYRPAYAAIQRAVALKAGRHAGRA